MTSFFNELPLALLLSALVGVFLALWRGNPAPRFKLWLTGWVLLTAHVLLKLLPAGEGLGMRFVQMMHDASLGIAGLAFLLSFSEIVDQPKWRNRVFVFVGGPIGVYAALLAFDGASRWFYLVFVACAYTSSAIAHWMWHKRKNAFTVVLFVLILGLGAQALFRVYAGDPEAAFDSILFAIYLICGLLTFRSHRRLTPGSVTTGVGFLSWSAVWALHVFAPHVIAYVGSTHQLWDMPKILVAFGMILLELENRSLAAQRAEQRERKLSRQVTNFSELTTKLLSGAEVNSFCGEIARGIVEVGNFQRAAILLVDDAGRLNVSGSAGLTPDAQTRLHDRVATASLDEVSRLLDRGRPLGPVPLVCNTSVAGNDLLSLGELTNGGIRPVPPNEIWQQDDELLVPLRSPLGNLVGCICLDSPVDYSMLNPEDMAALEMLASDLGVAVEKVSLQRKMLLHEKLASIGQLVSGVAHELNNPLTVIIGYSELLTDSGADSRHARELGVMRREALRMRNIIDNLLRFARQSKAQTRSASVQNAIQDALALREYDLIRSVVTVENDLPTDLPLVHMDEAQLKTVVVNLLSNAYDAVRDAEEKKISFYARQVGKRVVVSVVDSGSGFKDLNRAFDPFFSTKGLGRGSGLGLSICYGIVKQFGGEIYAQNSVPTGACVTMELDIAEESVPRAPKITPPASDKAPERS
jgi:nitrogen-specific signal transduction histidine kinase